MGYVFCMCVNVKAEAEEQMQNVHARILSQIEREEFFSRTSRNVGVVYDFFLFHFFLLFVDTVQTVLILSLPLIATLLQLVEYSDFQLIV